MMNNYILEYYQRIQDGRETVGKWITLWYEYVINGLEKKDFFFDAKKAGRCIKFVESFCHHTHGRNDLVRLELWQKAMLSVIFGVVDKDGVRQFREAFIVVGRKNGKSLLASAVANYMAFADGEYGADIYCVAPKLDQASIVFNDIVQTIKAEPELNALARSRKYDYYISQSNTTVKRIAFNYGKSDGFNPQLTVCDELAAWPGDPGLKQYEVLASALGARLQPLVLSITTAGYINDGIYDELFKRSTRLLSGDSREKRLAPFLYVIDSPQKWDDLNELKKSNPNMGVSVSANFFLDEIAKAEGSLSKRTEFLTKYCNVKQNSSQAWLRSQDIEKACGEHLSLDDFRGCYAVAGLDLSRTTDLTAAVLVIEKTGELYVFARFYLPSEKIDEATQRDGIPYRAYIERGELVPSGENFVDYHDAEKFLTDTVEEYEILPLMVGYDRYSVQYLVKDLECYGFHTDDVFQGTNLTPVIREFEGLLKDGVIHIGDNQLLKIHLLNSALKLDAETERVKLIKIGKNDHIDGMAALLDAMCVRQKHYGELGEQLRNEG